MSFTRLNQARFSRWLFAGLDLQTVTLLKRNDDQQQGTVTSYTLYGCWPTVLPKQGETIKGANPTRAACTWSIPGTELARNGIQYINALDRIIGTITKGTWQPESDTIITVKLMECYVNVDCLRRDGNVNGS